MKALEKKKRGITLNNKEKREIKIHTSRTILEKHYKRKLTDMQVRFLERGIRYIGYWDIETSDFNPYQNYMICFAFIKRDIITDKTTFKAHNITKQDIAYSVKNNNFNFDYKLLQYLSKYMKECDQIEGHYSTKFDMPYFRSRCLFTKQPHLIPEYGAVFYSDTWRKMKAGLKMPRNTLNNLNLLIGGKTDKTFVELEYWYKVRFKDSPEWQKSMDYITHHCKIDVKDSYRNGKAIEKIFSVSGALV